MTAFYDFNTGRPISESSAREKLKPVYQEAVTESPVCPSPFGTLSQDDYLQLAMDGHPGAPLCVAALDMIASIRDLTFPQQ